MHYATIKKCDVANGTGVRTSLFVSGCTHYCKGCFNEIAWPFNYGPEFTKETEDEIIESLKPDYIAGLTLLGGEPMETINQRGLVSLVRRVKELYPNKTIWCYTGYLFEDLRPGGRVYCDVTDELLSHFDVLVDGPFVESLKDLNLLFKGSSNQRTIDVQKSLQEGQVVLFPLKKGTI